MSSRARAVGAVSFEALFAESDVLSLHAPGQDGSPIVGREQLQLMKPTSYLI